MEITILFWNILEDVFDIELIYMVWKGPQVHSNEQRAVSFKGGEVCTTQSRIRPSPVVLQWGEPMGLTSLIGHSWERRSWSSFCSSFLVPRDCWTRRKSESSFRPASVKYLAKWSTLCLLTGKSSWERKDKRLSHNKPFTFCKHKEHFHIKVALGLSHEEKSKGWFLKRIHLKVYFLSTC